MKKLEKLEKIAYIKNVIDEWGSFLINDIDDEESPIINSMGKDNVQLAEGFNLHTVETTTYVHEKVVNQCDIEYEKLSDDVIDSIYLIVKNYEAEQLNS